MNYVEKYSLEGITLGAIIMVCYYVASVILNK